MPLQYPITFGTPYTTCSIKALVLGAGELGKEVVIALQRLGVEVHAADRYANAPAMQVAHHQHVLNMADPNALKSLIDSVAPHYVIPEIEAIATEVLLDIEKSGASIVTPSAAAANITMNRERIRTLASETLGLPTSQYRFASSFAEFCNACDSVGLPCFVKPTMSSSGKGQSRITSNQQYQTAWDYAIQGGRVNQGRVIVESQIDFDYEITLLTVRAINPSNGLVETHYCDPIGHRQQDGDYVESWQPQPMSHAALAKAKEQACAITAALGGLGLFGVELFIKGDLVYFSEVSPRPHDTGLVTMASQHQSEFELHARAILGLPVNTSRHSTAASSVIYAGLNAPALTYSHVEQALAIEGTDVRLFGKPEGFSRRRMGVVTARASDVDTARRNASQASSLIKVNVKR